MKASKWSINVTKANPVRWTICEAGNTVALTLTQPKKDGSSERLTVVITRDELEQISQHAVAGKWVRAD